MPSLAKGVAAANSSDCQYRADEKATFLICFKSIGRAGRCEPATGRFYRRDEFLIQAYKPHHNMLHINIPSFVNATSSSRLMSVLFSETAAVRAAMTTRKPCFIGLSFSMARKPSRSMRRHLDLITAQPSFVDVVSPYLLAILF